MTRRTTRLNRIEQIRWEVGSSLPQAVIVNMSDAEVKYFKQYCRLIGTYCTATDRDVLYDDRCPPTGQTLRVTAQAALLRDVPFQSSVYTTQGLLKLDAKEVQQVARTPTLDSLVHAGLFKVID